MDAWLDYVAQVVTRYKDKVDYWQVWNEPNIEAFNPSGATAAQYAELLKQSYGIIKNIDPEAEILDTIPVEFKCNCSKERFASGIMSLGKAEIEDMINEDGHAETICHFCGNKFYFDKDELTQLKEKAKR